MITRLHVKSFNEVEVSALVGHCLGEKHHKGGGGMAFGSF